ncbi:MAG: enoyl-CoA hydratase-related protein [Azospirillaceae bacterium]
MSDFILAEDPAEGLRLLTLNRPDKLNALCTPLMADLARALDEAEADSAVRVVALTGAGDRAFAAGADIAEYRGRVTKAFVAFQHAGRRLFDRLEALRKPTVAAIHGYALGGGLELALCCDVLIVTPAARLGLPEGQLGLCPGGGGTQRLIRSIGRHATADLLLSGNRLSGERAYAMGLAAELVEPAGLREAVAAKAARMRALGPLAQAEMKRLIRQGADAALPTALTLEQETLFRLYETDDAQEGIDAFLDKRRPEFRGE